MSAEDRLHLSKIGCVIGTQVDNTARLQEAHGVAWKFLINQTVPCVPVLGPWIGKIDMHRFHLVLRKKILNKIPRLDTQ